MADRAFETLTKTDSSVDPNDVSRSRNIRFIIYKDYQGYVFASVTYYYTYTYYILDEDGFRISNASGSGFRRRSVNGVDDSAYRFSYSLFPGGFEPDSADGSVSVYMMISPFIKTVVTEPENPGGAQTVSFTYEGDHIEIFKIVNAGEYDPDNSSTDNTKYYDFDFNLFLYKQKPIWFEQQEIDGEINSFTRQAEFDDIRFTNSYSAYVGAYMPEMNYDLLNTKTLVYTNITQGMVSEDDLSGEVLQADYTYFDPDDIDNMEQIRVSAFAYAEIRYDSNLVIVEKLVRIYNVKVTVYPSGSFAVADEPYSVIIRGETRTFHDTSGSVFNGDPVCDINASKTP